MAKNLQMSALICGISEKQKTPEGATRCRGAFPFSLCSECKVVMAKGLSVKRKSGADVAVSLTYKA
jgi:hypothetical protein